MTLLIRNAQFAELNQSMLLRFVRSQADLNKTLGFDQLLVIVNEAVGYGITNEEFVIRYINFSQEFSELFEEKPAWLKFVLEDNEFDALDKLDYIERRLKKEETENGE